ncbi:hypothetical protein RIF29_19093 [Crotalaria pallida]|uniref:Uncharacterized protein n=1 Tax=Crotalaria pallida TaxID=3830 RepID=A0AAN9F0P5_CROPI
MDHESHKEGVTKNHTITKGGSATVSQRGGGSVTAAVRRRKGGSQLVVRRREACDGERLCNGRRLATDGGCMAEARQRRRLCREGFVLQRVGCTKKKENGRR